MSTPQKREGLAADAKENTDIAVLCRVFLTKSDTKPAVFA